jgi:hypothetical protein
MNDIIIGRTNPAVRFKIQGLYLCERMNKFLKWKKNGDIIYYIILEIFKILGLEQTAINENENSLLNFD